MARIKILARKSSAPEIQAARSLIENIGMKVEEIEKIDPSSTTGEANDDTVILVVGTKTMCSDSGLEKEFSAVVNGGSRIVWMWPEGSDQADLPRGAGKYCFSVIPWDASKLKAVCGNDDLLVFEDPNGAPLPKVPTERNLCVEEEVPTK